MVKGRLLLLLLPVLLLAQPVSADDIVENAELVVTGRFCLDSGELQRNVTAQIFNQSTGSSEPIQTVVQEVNCPYGCVGDNGAARCRNPHTAMPVEIYVFLAASFVAFVILTFLRVSPEYKNVAVFPWLATFLALVLSVTSSMIWIGGEPFEAPNLTWLWGGLGVFMFVIALYMTFAKAGEQVQEAQGTRLR